MGTESVDHDSDGRCHEQEAVEVHGLISKVPEPTLADRHPSSQLLGRRPRKKKSIYEYYMISFCPNIGYL